MTNLTHTTQLDESVTTGLTQQQIDTIRQAQQQLDAIWVDTLKKTTRILSGLREALPAKNWMAFCQTSLPDGLSYKTAQRLLRAAEFIETTAVPESTLGQMSPEAVARIATAPTDTREVIEAELIEGGAMTIAEVEVKVGKPQKQNATQKLVEQQERIEALEDENAKLKAEIARLKYIMDLGPNTSTPDMNLTKAQELLAAALARKDAALARWEEVKDEAQGEPEPQPTVKLSKAQALVARSKTRENLAKAKALVDEASERWEEVKDEAQGEPVKPKLSKAKQMLAEALERKEAADKRWEEVRDM